MHQEQDNASDHAGGEIHQSLVARTTKRGRKARIHLKTRVGAPFSATEQGESANVMLKPNPGVPTRRKQKPGHRIRETQTRHAGRTADSGNGDGGGESQVECETPLSSDIPAIVHQLKALQSRRRFWIMSRIQTDNRIQNYVGRELGWNRDLPEKQRKAINKKTAIQIKLALSADESCELSKETVAMVLVNSVASKSCQKNIDETEKQMESLAKLLPAAGYVERTKGFGLKGLAIIMGEAGNDLRNFKSPAHLWSRFGVAPPWHYDTVTKNGKACNKKPRARCAQLWTLTDSLIRGNRDKTGKLHEFAKLYAERREHEATAHPEFVTGHDEKGLHITKHGDNRARRYVGKRLLRELWIEWRKATGKE